MMLAVRSTTGAGARRVSRCTGALRVARQGTWQPVGRSEFGLLSRHGSNRVPVGKLLTALGLPTRWLRRVRVGKQPLFLLAWALVPLRLKLVACGFVALGLLLVVGGVAALAVVIDQLA